MGYAYQSLYEILPNRPLMQPKEGNKEIHRKRGSAKREREHGEEGVKESDMMFNKFAAQLK